MQFPLQAWSTRVADQTSILGIAETRSAFIRRMLTIALVADLLFVGLAALSLRQSRLQYEERAEITTQNLSHALAGHITDVVEKIDLTVRSVADEVEQEIAAGGIDTKMLNAVIAKNHTYLPVMDGLRVVNAQGDNAYGIGVTPGVLTSVADRAYFIRLRSDPKAGLVISDPVVGRVSKKWSIIFARRVNQPDGSFAGLVYGTIALDNFVTIFSSIDVGKHGTIVLRNAELALIARYPAPQGISNIVGKMAASIELQHCIKARHDAGNYRTNGNFDHVERAYSYCKVSNHPFYVIVGLAPEDYIAAWRSEASGVSALVAMFVIGTFIASWVAYRGWMRRTIAVHALARQEAELLEANRQFEQATARANDMALQSKAASAAKSEFLANMSHEIRTPLNGVVGMLDLMGHTTVTAQQARYVSTARRSADMLLTVINDILDFSKIEAGKLSLESVGFDLRGITDDVGQVLAANGGGKDIEVLVHYAPRTPRWVTGDPARVRQILTNLVGNAVKFTAKGHVLIHVACDEVEQGRATFHIRVQDTGIGIAPDKLTRIFEKFTQADSSTTRRFGGTGLGLTICRMLVGIMNGRIWADSQVGCGSTFHFVLPLPLADEPQPAVAPASDETLRGLRVLIADDNPVNRQILQEMTESWQAVPTVVDSGSAALDLLRPGDSDRTPRFDLVILDGQMPGMDGFEVARRIFEEKLPIGGPVMMLTSTLHGPQAEQCRQMGIASYLVKPVRQAELMEAILAALGRQAARRDDPPSPTASTGTKLRILVAEDNEVNQEVVREILIKAGVGCDIVGNGKLAVEAVQKQQYDMVLMDCQMPEMDGLEATRSIRAIEGRGRPLARNGKRLFVLALTANAIKGDREICLAAGMDGYLSKPIEPVQLVAALNSALSAGSVTSEPPVSSPVRSGPEQCKETHGQDPHATEAHVQGLGTADGDAHASDGCPFDLASALSRCMGKQDSLERILQKFKDKALKDLQELSSHVQAADAQKIAFVAHSLKGAAASVSAEAVRQAACDLEQIAKAADFLRMEACMQALSEEIARCVDYLPKASV
jgi:signal transduction histidine kinase/DNA-binding response OmpR family regulator/HPt (histidine-containing phosphotransfer) domain-containing protein